MRFLMIFFISQSLWAQSIKLGEEATLGSTIKDFQSLQKELDRILNNKRSDCLPNTGALPDKLAPNYCLVKSYCTLENVHKDSPILYENSKGEKIINDDYFVAKNNISACLREKFSDEIKEKKEALLESLGLKHLKKILAANQTLIGLTAKHGEGARLQRISAEVLTLSIQAGLKAEPVAWGNAASSKDELLVVLGAAEKRTGLKLNRDIKKTLVEIEYLKNHPDYIKEAEEFEKNLVPVFLPSDPLVDWTLLTDPVAAGSLAAMNANREKLKNKSQDAYNLFVETQTDTIAYLNEKKNEKNMLQIERMIERVKTIKFNTPRLTDELREECKYPNAFYNSRNHSFTLCPQFLNYPSMAIKETIAHEMAHSFDSCNLSGNFYKSSGPEVVLNAPFEIDIKKTPGIGNFRNTRGEEPKELKLKNKIQEKMKYADHPFSTTMSCLTDPRSVGATTLNIKALKKKAKKHLEELTAADRNNPHNALARGANYFDKNAEEYFSYFEGCDISNFGDTLGKSQIQEAFADKISADIMARDLNKMAFTDARKAMLEISLGYSNVCPNETQSLSKLRDFAVKIGCPNYLENRTNETIILNQIDQIDPGFDPHPTTLKRLEKNLMAHPDIRKVLKCPKDKKVIYCE